MNHKRCYCPNCKKLIITKVSDYFNEEFLNENGFATKELQNYCDNCGQAFDWSDIK